MPIGASVGDFGYQAQLQNAYSAGDQMAAALMSAAAQEAAYARMQAGVSPVLAVGRGAQNFGAENKAQEDAKDAAKSAGHIIDLAPEDYRVIEDVPLLEDKSTE